MTGPDAGAEGRGRWSYLASCSIQCPQLWVQGTHSSPSFGCRADGPGCLDSRAAVPMHLGTAGLAAHPKAWAAPHPWARWGPTMGQIELKLVLSWSHVKSDVFLSQASGQDCNTTFRIWPGFINHYSYTLASLSELCTVQDSRWSGLCSPLSFNAQQSNILPRSSWPNCCYCRGVGFLRMQSISLNLFQ